MIETAVTFSSFPDAQIMADWTYNPPRSSAVKNVPSVVEKEQAVCLPLTEFLKLIVTVCVLKFLQLVFFTPSQWDVTPQHDGDHKCGQSKWKEI